MNSLPKPGQACSACDAPFNGRRCDECGSVSETYLHDLVRVDLKADRLERERAKLEQRIDELWPEVERLRLMHDELVKARTAIDEELRRYVA